MQDSTGDRPSPIHPDWRLVRALAVLILSAATSASSLVLLGLGAIVLVPIVLVAGLLFSAFGSSFKWVCFGVVLSVGLYVGGFRMPFFSIQEPSAIESVLWFAAGLFGLGMVVRGYYQILLDD